MDCLKSDAFRRRIFLSIVTLSRKAVPPHGIIEPSNQKGAQMMKITLNPDQEVVNTVREGLRQTGGYCPCRLERTEETKCMCREFKEQVDDPAYEGFCHCMLYYKSPGD